MYYKVAAIGFYDNARRIVEAQLRANPDAHWLHSFLGIAYAGVGRRDEAVQEASRAVEMMPVTRDARVGPYPLFHLVRTYILLGEYDPAIEQLETLMSIPSHFSRGWLSIHPLFDPLRDNPRFQRLLKRGE